MGILFDVNLLPHCHDGSVMRGQPVVYSTHVTGFQVWSACFHPFKELSLSIYAVGKVGSTCNQPGPLCACWGISLVRTCRFGERCCVAQGITIRRVKIERIQRGLRNIFKSQRLKHRTKPGEDESEEAVDAMIEAASMMPPRSLNVPLHTLHCTTTSHHA